MFGLLDATSLVLLLLGLPQKLPFAMMPLRRRPMWSFPANRVDRILTVFTVPQTHDMVSQLLSPSEPKNLSDVVVLALLAAHIWLLWVLPAGAKIPVFAVVYLFWRAGYNAGIGWLLHNQSHHRTMIRWAEKTKIFVNPATGDNPHPILYNWIKREMETKIPHDYSFETAPIEYNTWLVFRRLVDVIPSYR
jgi:phosphatidylethanolamine N-methyltransferase